MDDKLRIYCEIVNKTEDLFEYRYKNYSREEIRDAVMGYIDTGVNKLRELKGEVDG